MYYNENTILYFNGTYCKASDVGINPYSQSLHYGYAVFEGIKSYKTAPGVQIFKAQEHYDRLKRSAEVMKIPLDYSTDDMINITKKLLELNDLSDAYIRPIVVCAPNMSLSKCLESALLIEVWAWDNGYLMNGLKVKTSLYKRPNPNAFHVDVKVCGHYVNSILACQDAKDDGFDESLLTDENDFVAESSGANVFYESKGILYTPSKGSILPGITRATVIEICQTFDIPVYETQFTPDDMKGADAAFFCGTAAEIVSLASLDNVPFAKSWETTLSAQIQKAYRELVLGNNLTELKKTFVHA